MAALSISQAWEETKARIAADGKLMAIVAAALVAFPGIISGVVAPETARTETSLGLSLLILVCAILALIGQLSLIRLAIGPAVSVGEAIGHGARRMPLYLVAGLLLTLALVLLLVPFLVVLYAAGVPIDRSSEDAMLASPLTLILLLAYFVLLVFICIRMLLSSPVASEEAAGPIQILRRSWDLTSGHWWRLFGFMIMFLIGAVVAIGAVNLVASGAAVALFGPADPMSVSALVIAVCVSTINAAATVLLAVMLARIYLQVAGRDSIEVGVPKSGI